MAIQSFERLEKNFQSTGQATDSSDLLGLSLAALDLQDWEIGLQLARRAAACAPQEPYLHLHCARALTMRAEYQFLCLQLEVEVHAPGTEALSEEAYQEFREALQKAQRSLPGETPPARSMLARRWIARGQVAFLGIGQPASARRLAPS
jgi:hypothetical protein